MQRRRDENVKTYNGACHIKQNLLLYISLRACRQNYLFNAAKLRNYYVQPSPMAIFFHRMLYSLRLCIHEMRTPLSSVFLIIAYTFTCKYNKEMITSGTGLGVRRLLLPANLCFLLAVLQLVVTRGLHRSYR